LATTLRDGQCGGWEITRLARKNERVKDMETAQQYIHALKKIRVLPAVHGKLARAAESYSCDLVRSS
jgi:hypothetical protein